MGGLQQDLQNSIHTAHRFRSGHLLREAVKQECEKTSQDPKKKCQSPREVAGALSFKSVLGMIAASSVITTQAAAPVIGKAIAQTAIKALPVTVKHVYNVGVEF